MKKGPAPKKDPSEKGSSEVSQSEIPIDFETQRFCSKCGKIIELEARICKFCKMDLRWFQPIRNRNEALQNKAIRALTHSESEVRKKMVDNLGDMGDRAFLGLITYILLNDSDEDVRKEAADELGDRGFIYSIDVLKRALKDDSEKVRDEAKSALKEIEKKRKIVFKGRVTQEKQAGAKKAPAKKAKRDITGLETIGEKIKGGMPWLLGRFIRKPKIAFPKFKYRRVSIPMPAKTLGIIVIYIMLFILQTGVVYLIYKEPPALGAKANGDPIFLYPSIHDSFIVEGIVASILIFCASMGFLMLYQASKHSYNRKMALRILVMGVLMVFIAWVALQYMIGVKSGNIQA